MFYQEPAEEEANLLQKIIQGTNEKRKLLGYQPAYANAMDLVELTRDLMGQTGEQKLINQQLLEEELRMRRGYE